MATQVSSGLQWMSHIRLVSMLPLPLVCVVIRSSMHAWKSAVMAVTRSPVVACSRLSQQQLGRHIRRWSCATTVERATTLSTKIAGVHATQCRQPVVAHWWGSVVLCRYCSDKLKWQGRRRSTLECAASEALEKEETHAHSSLPSTLDLCVYNAQVSTSLQQLQQACMWQRGNWQLVFGLAEQWPCTVWLLEWCQVTVNDLTGMQ